MPVLQTLSLVIPSYNRGHLIDETIASALNQETPFDDIIVVDDGSTDDTLARLKQYGDRITVIASANAGVQKARNSGVAASNASHIVLCDSDDLLHPAFSATMRRAIAERPDTDIWYSNFIPFTNEGDYPDKLTQAPADLLEGALCGEGYCVEIPDLYRRVLRFQPFFPSGSAFSKRFYEAIGGYDPRFNRVGGEDFEFLLRAVSRGRLGYLTAPLVRVRKHDSNDSRDTLRMLQGEIRILEHSLQCHPGAGQHRQQVQAVINRRRREAFDIAYARGDFSSAKETAAKFESLPTDPKFQLKHAITACPAVVRDVVWRLSQSGRTGT
jgi:glycosyltransferase involved in cell wall biosynthesis